MKWRRRRRRRGGLAGWGRGGRGGAPRAEKTRRRRSALRTTKLPSRRGYLLNFYGDSVLVSIRQRGLVFYFSFFCMPFPFCFQPRTAPKRKVFHSCPSNSLCTSNNKLVLPSGKDGSPKSILVRRFLVGFPPRISKAVNCESDSRPIFCTPWSHGAVWPFHAFDATAPAATSQHSFLSSLYFSLWWWWWWWQKTTPQDTSFFSSLAAHIISFSLIFSGAGSPFALVICTCDLARRVASERCRLRL